MMNMENYFKEIKGIIDQLAKISLEMPEDLLLLLLLHSLPKEYQFFIKLFIGNDLLPSISNLKSKLLDEEMEIKMDVQQEVANNVL